MECAQMLYLQNEIIDMLQVRLSAPIQQNIVFQLYCKIPQAFARELLKRPSEKWEKDWNKSQESQVQVLAGSQQATGLTEDGFWLGCLLACSCQVDTENVHSPRRPTPPAGSAEGNRSGGGLFPWVGDLRCHQVMGRRSKTPQKVTTKGGVWGGGVGRNTYNQEMGPSLQMTSRGRSLH